MTEKESSPPLSGGTEQEKLKHVDLSIKREVSWLPSNRKQDIVNNLATLLEIDSGKINIKPLEKSIMIRLEMSDYLYSVDAYRSSDHDPVIVGLEPGVVNKEIYQPLIRRP